LKKTLNLLGDLTFLKIASTTSVEEHAKSKCVTVLVRKIKIDTFDTSNGAKKYNFQPVVAFVNSKTQKSFSRR
jgi:hypothetical protein